MVVVVVVAAVPKWEAFEAVLECFSKETQPQILFQQCKEDAERMVQESLGFVFHCKVFGGLRNTC